MCSLCNAIFYPPFVSLTQIRTVIITWLPIILRIKMPAELYSNRNRQQQAEAAQYTNNNHTEKSSATYCNNIGANRRYSLLTPASPTHQELFTLTQKMREYELLCHRRGYSLREPKQPTTTAAHCVQSGDPGASGRRTRANNLCPYAFTTYPPPPNHSHMSMDGVSTEPNAYLFSLMPEECHSHLQPETAAVDADTNLEEDGTNPCCCCCCNGTGASSTHEYFVSIMQELRFITNRLRREDDLSDIIGEWKFAAIVIDRLCLIVFSTFAIISTAVCLLSAPHLIA